jgi:hypothetical protein
MTNLIQLEPAYFEWLESQVRTPRTHTFHDLLGEMHHFEFIWTVPNDDNRVEDGRDLRHEFFDGAEKTELAPYGITFLEVLVALSRRCAFTAGGEPDAWAWKLIKNIHLNKMSDPLTHQRIRRVRETLYAVTWREYGLDGDGGFFPLRYPKENQTKVELWYQMNAYVMENEKI